MSFGTWTPRHYKRNGEKLPSVTTILSLLDKPALVQWAANTSAEYIAERVQALPELTTDAILSICESAKKEFRKVSRKAMDIGTTVHTAVEQYIKTGATPLSPSDEVLSAFIAFLEWEKANNVKYLQTELTIYGDGYAGTLDLLCNLGGKTYVVDFKTSTGIWPEMSLQLAAYRHAVNADVQGHGILRLDKVTGFPEWRDFSDTYEKDLQAFLLLRDFWHLYRSEK